MKDIKKNNDKEESMFVSGKAGIIVHSFFFIFVVLAPFIFLPSLFIIHRRNLAMIGTK